jgi:lipoprotein-releasing system ATP-binding protein
MDLLKMMDLQHRAHHKPDALSGGEQQRVAVARALANAPAVVFADEPSGNLDAQTAAQLHNLFFDLREKLGQTFIVVTHNAELAGMADRNLVMSQGQIISE